MLFAESSAFAIFNSMDSLTIVAPMTPMGVSAVAALRVSGTHVRDVVRRLFGARAAENLGPRMANLGTARDPQTGKVLDSLLYIYFEAPNSYTGEDVLELYPHGNPLIVRDLLQAIRGIEGVRLAEPGEYTRRAFLNGKMDLTQAESVADVIHSANRAELENAHRLLSGALSKKIATLTAQVKDISARLELDVDFAEEEADPDFSGWKQKFENIRDTIKGILSSFRGKANLSRLPLAVLYGAPNAGKSSLVNALLGEDRVLVSNVPGTTRDFVEVRLFLDGGEIRLIDTAGIADKATDELDALSMKKSREILDEADMKILVVDGNNSAGNKEGVILSYTTLGTKSLSGCYPPCGEAQAESKDLKPDFVVVSKSDLAANVIARSEATKQFPDTSHLHVSSKTGEGLDDLKKVMNAVLFKKSENAEDLWITSEREKSCLEEALAGVDRVLDLLEKNPAVELLAFEMQLVRRALQSITGEISSEDILQSIFAGFCIGK